MRDSDWGAIAVILLSLGTFLDVLLWPPLVILDLCVLVAAGYVLWLRRRAES